MPDAPRLQCPKCGSTEISVARNMRSTGMCANCGFTQDDAYKTMQVTAPSGRMRVDLFAHVSKKLAYEAGEKLGITGEALRQFSYIGYEHKITYEFNATVPFNAVVVAIDGRPVAPPK